MPVGKHQSLETGTEERLGYRPGGAAGPQNHDRAFRRPVRRPILQGRQESVSIGVATLEGPIGRHRHRVDRADPPGDRAMRWLLIAACLGVVIVAITGVLR